MPIRVRLALIHASLLTAALLTFAVVLRALLVRNLYTELDTEIVSIAKGTAQLLEFEIAEADREGEANLSPHFFELESLAQGLHLQLLDPQRRTVFISTNLNGARLWDESVPPPRASALDTFHHRALGRLRRYVFVARSTRGPFTVITAKSLADVDRAVRALHRLLLFVLLFALAFVGFIGYALAGRALRPVADITATAQAIRFGDLSRRIALQGPPDELKRLADAFDEMIASLEQLLNAQRRFLADASHELRTPLTVILSALQVSLRTRDPDREGPERRRNPLRETLQVVYEEARHMKRLVDDLMTLSRADIGEQPLQRAPLSLDDLLKEVCEAAQWMMDNRCLELQVDEEVTLMADADRLKQLVMNLLDNAVKNTPPHGIIFVGLHTQQGHAIVTVSDNGEGIPPEHLPHIFDRFYRVDEARSRENGGSGLGLAICRWIAQAHGGALTVCSEVGRGTTFVLSLPLDSS